MKALDNVTASPPTAVIENLPPAGRWYTTNEHINWRITGGTNPIDLYEMINGGDVAHYGRNVGDTGYVNLSAGGSGWKECKVRVSNSVGTNFSDTWIGGYDIVPPTAARTGGAAPQTWVHGSQTVTYAGNDVHSGFKKSRWRIDGGAFSDWTYDNPATVPLPSADGKHILDVEGEDNAWTGSGQNGNSALVQIGEFWVDNTPPVLSFVGVTPPSPGDPTQVDITVDGSDPGGANASGLANVVVTVDGGSALPDSGGAYHWDASTAADGPHTLTATATDNAGNATSVTRTYVVDRSAPSTTIAIGPASPNGLDGWYVTAPTFTLAATSSAGTTTAHYRINGGADAVYAGPVTLQARGVVKIEHWAVSAAGRKGPVGLASVKVDTTPPAGFTLEDEGAKTPSLSELNVSLRGTIDAESGYRAFRYKVGAAPGDDRYWTDGWRPARGPWLTADGLFLPSDTPIFVTLQVQNGAGLWSDWSATDGIAVDRSAWDHAVWNAVFGAAGGYSTAEDGAHQGTLGESILGLASSGDGLLDAGFWSLFAAPKLTFDLTLGDYGASRPAVPITVELRQPGTTTVLETHTLLAKTGAALSIALGRTGTFDVAIKGPHWLRVVRRQVDVSAFGASLGGVALVNGDVDGNNQVNLLDYTRLKAAYGSHAGMPNWNPGADLDGNGTVTVLDYSILQRNYGKRGD